MAAKHRIGAFALAALLAACTPQIRDYGYAPSETELAEIVVGVDSRDRVVELIGYPASSGVVSEDAWYYVAARQVTVGFKAPKTTDRQIVAISFNAEGTVRNIERFGLEDGRIIVLNRRVTEDTIGGVSFLRQAFSNIGRLNAGDIVNE